MIVREKIKQANKLLGEFGMDCWITFVRESEMNGDPALDLVLGAPVTWHSAFIITSAGRNVAIVGQFDRQTVVDTGAYDEVHGFVEEFRGPFVDVMRELNPTRIAVNYSVGSEICDGITHGMYLTLQEMLGEIDMADRLESAEKIVSALRERKTGVEVKWIKKAIDQTEDIYRKVQAMIHPGVTERAIADFVHEEIAARELEYAWDRDTCPAVFTGPETAGAHYKPTDRKVEGGHLISMDFGVKVNEYCSDVQRSFYVLAEGETEPPEAVSRAFNTIVESIEMARQAIKPGVIGLDVDTIARGYIVEHGYEEYPHGLGHQVGQFAHDGVALLGPAWAKYAQKPYQKLEEGMVFTIEPRINVPGHGIASVEEMVVITSAGAEFLTETQTELRLIK
jgi:Xaa-Pro aminopeptidase